MNSVHWNYYSLNFFNALILKVKQTKLNLHGLNSGFLHHKSQELKTKDKTHNLLVIISLLNFNFPYPTDNEAIILCHFGLFAGKGKLKYHFIHRTLYILMIYESFSSLNLPHQVCTLACVCASMRIGVRTYGCSSRNYLYDFTYDDNQDIKQVFYYH